MGAIALLLLTLLLAALPLISGPTLTPRADASIPITITGPDSIKLGQQAHLVADGGELGSTYEWDLDSNGTFETSTGTDKSVDFGFAQGGFTTVTAKVTGPDGSVGFQGIDVDVTRPDISQLLMDPADPAPGDKVTFTAVTRTDGAKPIAYAWKLEGVGVSRSSAVIGTAKPGLPEQVLDAAGQGMSVTTSKTFTATMPKGDDQLGRTLTFEVRIIDEFGGMTKLATSATLQKPGQMVLPDPYLGKGTVDCNNIPKGIPPSPCAAISFDEPIAGAPMWFQDATPGIRICIPKANPTFNPPLKRMRVEQLKDLPYPPAKQFGQVVVSAPRSGAPSRIATGGRTATPRDVKQDCKTLTAKTVSWNFGDGSPTLTAPEGLDYSQISHQYATPGDYSATLVTMVPYVLDKNDKFGAGLKYFKAKIRTNFKALPTRCESLSMNGLQVSSTSGCFVVHEGLDGADPTYTAQVGYGVNVAGMSLGGKSPVVDPTHNVISTPTGVMNGTVTFAEKPGGSKQEVLPPTSVLPISPPQADPELGDVVALPAVPVDPSVTLQRFHGLQITSRQAYLRPDGPPVERIYMKLPKPMQGETPPVVVESGTSPTVAARMASDAAGAASFAGEDTDWEMTLDGLDLGGFGVQKGTIAHRTAGGWIASIDSLDAGGLGTFKAPYLPPGAGGTDGACETISGPSGVELTESGGFKRGGLQWIPSPPLAIGPAGSPFASLNCLYAQGNASPFVIEGKVGMRVPYQGPIQVDGCFDIGLLSQGDQPVADPSHPGTGAVPGCGTAPFTAPADLLWLRAQGQASLYGVVPLANAYADARIGGDYAAISAGGGLNYDFSIVSVGMNVDGTIVLVPETAFSLIGTANVCLHFIIDECGKAQAGVSSKGFGACISLGGVVYLEHSGWHVFVASCDLKKYLAVQKTLRMSEHDRVMTSAMPAGLEQAAYVVTSPDDTTPALTITRPNGSVVTDNGRSLQEYNGLTITKWPSEHTTTITLDHPAAGDWKVEAQPVEVCDLRTGCFTTVPPIDVELRTPIPEPTVTGTVSETDATRRLSYKATLDKGDNLMLQETGPFGTRELGAAPRGKNTIVLPRAGKAETRSVKAVIERDGIPIKTIFLDKYAALGARKLPTPSDVTLDSQGSRTVASWTPVPGARGYSVTAHLADGRVISKDVSDASAVFPGITRLTAGKVTVQALKSVGRDSAAQLSKLSPLTRVKVYY